jgi:hypothetical protein
MAGEDLRDEVADVGTRLRRDVPVSVLSTAVAGIVSATLTWLLLRAVPSRRRRRLARGRWAGVWTADR